VLLFRNLAQYPYLKAEFVKFDWEFFEVVFDKINAFVFKIINFDY